MDSGSNKKTGNNKYITPVDLEVVKEVPNLQKVGLDGTSPINTGALSQSYKVMLKSFIGIHEDMSKAKEENVFYEAKTTLDEIRRQHELTAVQQYPGNHTDDPELMKNRVNEYNSFVVQNSLDHLAQYKSLMKPEKYYQLEGYVKGHLYEDSIRLVTLQKQAEIKQITTNFKIKEAGLINRVYDIYQKSYANSDPNLPATDTVRGEQFEADVDDLIKSYLLEAEPHYVNLPKAVRDQTMMQNVADAKIETVNLLLKEVVDKRFVNPSLRKVLTDAKGNHLADSEGNIQYVRDSEGGYEIDPFKLKMAVNTSLEKIEENFQSNIDEHARELGLNSEQRALYSGAMWRNLNDTANKLRSSVYETAKQETDKQTERQYKMGLDVSESGIKKYNSLLGYTNTKGNQVPHVEYVNMMEDVVISNEDALQPEVIQKTYNQSLESIVAPGKNLTLTGIGEGVHVDNLTKAYSNASIESTFSDALRTTHSKFVTPSDSFQIAKLKKSSILYGLEQKGITISEDVMDAVLAQNRDRYQDQLVNTLNEKATYDRLFGANNLGKVTTFPNKKIEATYNALAESVGNDPQSLDFALKKVFIAGQSNSGELGVSFLKKFNQALNETSPTKSVGHADSLAPTVVTVAIHEVLKSNGATAKEQDALRTFIKQNVDAYKELSKTSGYTPVQISTEQAKLNAVRAKEKAEKEARKKYFNYTGYDYEENPSIPGVRTLSTEDRLKQQETWD